MVDIIPATIRDLTWITANLRPKDAEELYATQYERNPVMLALRVFDAGDIHRYVVTTNNGPVCAFGANEYQPGVWSAWAFGTPGMWRAVPAVTRFIKNEVMPDLMARGANRIEARSIATHDGAHRWLISLGARCECEMAMYGKDGQTFRLFAWTRTKEPAYVPAREAKGARINTRAA